jgi:hypothetical protein
MKGLLILSMSAFLLGIVGAASADDNPNFVNNSRAADRPSGVGRSDPSPKSPSVIGGGGGSNNGTKSTIRLPGDNRGGPGSTNPDSRPAK